MEYPVCFDCLLAARFWFLVAGGGAFILLSIAAMAIMKSPAKRSVTGVCIVVGAGLIIFGAIRRLQSEERAAYASTPPLWQSQIEPHYTEVALWRSYFDRMIEVAGRILQETHEMDWDSQQRKLIDRTLHEVVCGRWMDLRKWGNPPGQNSASAPEFLMLGESCSSGTTKICLYIDNILLRIRKNKIDDLPDEQELDARVSFISHVLVHELCHIDEVHGGFLSPPVPGEREPQFPCCEHLGLWRWMAFVAHWKARDWRKSGEPALVWGAQATQRSALKQLRGPWADDISDRCKNWPDVDAGPERGWSPVGNLPPD